MVHSTSLIDVYLFKPISRNPPQELKEMCFIYCNNVLSILHVVLCVVNLF
jgi:hypothetical protein